MPRTFFCFPSPYVLGSTHKWTVEDSPLAPEVTILQCPFHEDPQSYSEGPYQGPDLLLVETLERMKADGGALP